MTYMNIGLHYLLRACQAATLLVLFTSCVGLGAVLAMMIAMLALG
jgi:hypothetical protein